MYLDSLGAMTDRSLLGHLASGVPGSVAGLFAAHERYGSMAWADLVAPAIRLAEEGFEADEDFSGAIRDEASRLSGFAGSSALFLPGGQPVAAGSTFTNPDIAAALRRIAERGPDGFYRGETADLIVAEMQRGGGLISKADLARYQPKWREPVTFEYRGHTIVSMPPASSGGITLAMMAGLLGGYDPSELGWHSPEGLHLVAESMRRAFDDRNEFMADPDFVDVPRQRLMSAAYLDSLLATIDSLRATPSSEVRAGLAAVVESDHTTHFSVVDDRGNAVALTTTINELFGSAVTVTGAGFLLNDEMDDFAAKPGTPNGFGLVQGEANAIQPGKRMLLTCAARLA
jgi:gamma-glutamyltranspeptidase/glutathione hydrolase